MLLRSLLLGLGCLLPLGAAGLAGEVPAVVSADGLRGKVLCGYQGWFRCPGDAADVGWVHWSRDHKRIVPETLTFEMWPDVSEYGPAERYPAPGFTYPDGRQAELFSSDCPATVLRHFQWLRDYGLDGVWLQRFLVGLPEGPGARQFPTIWRVMQHVRSAAQQTGRVWAVSYDIAQMPGERIYDAIVHDWKRLVDEKIVADERYVHQEGRPVVQIWGFYPQTAQHQVTPQLSQRLIDFFHAPGPYAAYLVGGGTWDRKRIVDPAWQEVFYRFDAYAPWNVGNYGKDRQGVAHASTHYWAEDLKAFQSRGKLWLPVVYPGFSWDNLTRKEPGTSLIPRRGGEFLWEQFHSLSKLGVDAAYVAMFDEVDEGTAIFKITSAPPTQAHFVGYEGRPSDWYLRLAGEAARRLRAKEPIPAEMPTK